MTHVFISYLREDQEVVDRLSAHLSTHGVVVWLDRDQIRPGERWQTAIRLAVQDGAHFLACCSRFLEGRPRSFMDEEVAAALQETAQRSAEWLIPVQISEHGLEAATRRWHTLKDIQWVDLSQDWELGAQRLVDIVSPRTTATRRKVLDALERHSRKKLLEQRARVAVLEELRATSPTAVSITCRSASREWRLSLRPDVTLSELSTAIAREYYKEDFGKNEFYFCDRDGAEYEGLMTTAELQSHSVDVLILHTREPRIGAIALAMPRSGLQDDLKQLRGASHAFKWLRMRCYLWVFGSSPWSRAEPPTWLVNEANAMALLYAEKNTHIVRAMKLVSLLERSVLGKRWEYLDTIAWVWFRAGLVRRAFELLVPELPDAALRDVTTMYHVYFLCRHVGDDETAATVRDWFAQRFPEVDWDNARTPDLGRGISADLFWHSLQYQRVLFNDAG